jgi:hypothetical protein
MASKSILSQGAKVQPINLLVDGIMVDGITVWMLQEGNITGPVHYW